MINNQTIISYACGIVICLVVGIGSNAGCDEKLKGRYILLGSIFWPVVIVVIMAKVLWEASLGLMEHLKENFFKVF